MSGQIRRSQKYQTWLFGVVNKHSKVDARTFSVGFFERDGWGRGHRDNAEWLGWSHAVNTEKNLLSDLVVFLTSQA